MSSTDLSQVRETIALLNSMVLCGEDHSEQSAAMVRQALATIDARASEAAAPREGEEEALYEEWRAAVIRTDGAKATFFTGIETAEFKALQSAWREASDAEEAALNALRRAAAREAARGEGV